MTHHFHHGVDSVDAAVVRDALALRVAPPDDAQRPETLGGRRPIPFEDLHRLKCPSLARVQKDQGEVKELPGVPPLAVLSSPGPPGLPLKGSQAWLLLAFL